MLHAQHRISAVPVSTPLTIAHTLFAAEKLRLFVVSADYSIHQLTANNLGELLLASTITATTTRTANNNHLVTVTQHETEQRLTNIQLHFKAQSNESLVPVFFTLQCESTLHVSFFFHACLALEASEMQLLRTQVAARLHQLERARMIFLLSVVGLPSTGAPTIRFNQRPRDDDDEPTTIEANSSAAKRACTIDGVASIGASTAVQQSQLQLQLQQLQQQQQPPPPPPPQQQQQQHSDAFLVHDVNDVQLAILASVALGRVVANMRSE